MEDLLKQWLPILLISGNLGSQWKVMLIPLLIYGYKYLAEWYRNRFTSNSNYYSIKLSYDPRYQHSPWSMRALCWYLRKYVKPAKCVYKIDREKINYHDNDNDEILSIEKTYMLDSCPPEGIDFEFVSKDKSRKFSINLFFKVTKENINFFQEIVLSSPFEDDISYFIDQVITMFIDYSNQEKKSSIPHVYTLQTNKSHEWIKRNPLLHKTFDNLFIDRQIKSKLITDIETFINGQDFYTKIGIPYKRGYLFYGPPGTGKSSSSYAIANHTKRNLYKLSMVGLDDDQFRTIISQIPSGVVLTIDDVDRVSGTCKKSSGFKLSTSKKNNSKNGKNNDMNDDKNDDDNDDKKNDASDKKNDTNVSNKNDNTELVIDMDFSSSKINISTFLEIFDGYDYLHDTIVILTTNNHDKLDPALIRPGRADLALNITHPSDQTCIDIFNYFFPDKNNSEIVNSHNRSTAEIITRIIIPNKHDYNKCLELFNSN